MNLTGKMKRALVEIENLDTGRRMIGNIDYSPSEVTHVVIGRDYGDNHSSIDNRGIILDSETVYRGNQSGSRVSALHGILSIYKGNMQYENLGRLGTKVMHSQKVNEIDHGFSTGRSVSESYSDNTLGDKGRVLINNDSEIYVPAKDSEYILRVKLV
jgi:hypothetical protein